MNISKEDYEELARIFRKELYEYKLAKERFHWYSRYGVGHFEREARDENKELMGISKEYVLSRLHWHEDMFDEVYKAYKRINRNGKINDQIKDPDILTKIFKPIRHYDEKIHNCGAYIHGLKIGDRFIDTHSREEFMISDFDNERKEILYMSLDDEELYSISFHDLCQEVNNKNLHFI